MGPDSITIRRAHPAHPALTRLHHENLPADWPPDWTSGWWWLAWNGGKAVGFAGLQPSARWSDTMYMCRSGVAEDARGQGLQRRLLRVREAFARKNGARWLISDTTDNTISANNLIAVGFRLFNPSVPWGLKHALYWCKRIAE